MEHCEVALIGAFAVILFVVALELLLVRNKNKEQRHRDAVLFAIAKKFGVTEVDIRKQEESLKGSPKKKHK